jgi:hypothetical protein
MLTKDQIISAMSLDADGVTAALRNNDYQDESVLTAVFKGMNDNGSFVYECTYNDTYDATEQACMVYIHFNERMQMVAEY